MKNVEVKMIKVAYSGHWIRGSGTQGTAFWVKETNPYFGWYEWMANLGYYKKLEEIKLNA